MTIDVTARLQDMLALLDNGDAWCKGAGARDSDGADCPIHSPNAIMWDIFGALRKVTDSNEEINAVYELLLSRIPPDRRNRGIECYNDVLGWSDVVTLLSPP